MVAGAVSAEVGAVPADWEVLPLGDLLVLSQYGLSIRGERSGAVPILRMNCQQDGRVVFRDLQFVDLEPRLLAGYRLHDGDLLFNRTNSYELVGRTAMFEGEREAVFASYLVRLRVDRNRVHPAFLNFFLNLPATQERLKGLATRGVSQSNISASKLKTLPVVLPSLDVQRRIADLLAVIQSARLVGSERIDRLRALKAATMAKLFRDGLRGDAPRVTEVGDVPRSWEIARLGDLCGPPDGLIQTGPFGSQLHASDYTSDGVPIVNPTHMTDGRIRRDGIPTVSGAHLESLVRHQLRQGDILFSRRGDVGRHALVTAREAGWLCGTGCLLVRPRSSAVDPSYLAAYCDSDAAQVFLQTNAAGTIMPNTNTKILGALPVVLPSLEEQRSIAAALDCLSESIQVATRTAGCVRHVFDSLLPMLVTGHVRLGKARDA